MDKPTNFILKGYAGRFISKGDDPTDTDRTMMYNGIPVKWFIGDLNFSRAKELGCTEPFGYSGGCKVVKPGPYWEAWGSCLGKAYQLFAYFNEETSELTEIRVCENNGSSYFSQENYDKLTK